MGTLYIMAYLGQNVTFRLAGCIIDVEALAKDLSNLIPAEFSGRFSVEVQCDYAETIYSVAVGEPIGRYAAELSSGDWTTLNLPVQTDADRAIIEKLAADIAKELAKNDKFEVIGVRPGLVLHGFS